MTAAAPAVSRTRKSAGAILIFAAVTFWLAWLFMPDAGTNDAARIQEVVREHRGSVFLSLIVQIISSVAFVPAVLLIARLPLAQAQRRVFVGGALLLIGAMGMCADAIFHLAAYYMTADGVAPESMHRSMMLLQTEGIRFLLPLLLSFLIGGIVLALGLQHAGLASPGPVMVFASAIATAGVGGITAAAMDAGRYAVVLLFLGLFALALVWLGVELMRPQQKPKLKPKRR